MTNVYSWEMTKTKQSLSISTLMIRCVGDKKALHTFKTEIKKYFVTKEEGKVKDYVGCMMKKINSGIWLHQSDLIKKIELQFEQEIKDITDYRTPGAPGEGTLVKDDDICITEKEQFKYRSAVGMTLFLIKYSRTNISTALRELSKSNIKTNYAHYKQMLRAVNYVLKTRNWMLKFVPTSEKDKWEFKCMCDSHNKGDKDNRLSVKGYCIVIGRCKS